MHTECDALQLELSADEIIVFAYSESELIVFIFCLKNCFFTGVIIHYCITKVWLRASLVVLVKLGPKTCFSSRKRKF
jgi:hypothetical protein